MYTLVGKGHQFFTIFSKISGPTGTKVLSYLDKLLLEPKFYHIWINFLGIIYNRFGFYSQLGQQVMAVFPEACFFVCIFFCSFLQHHLDTITKATFKHRFVVKK
jgi:hypothetical protein